MGIIDSANMKCDLCNLNTANHPILFMPEGWKLIYIKQKPGVVCICNYCDPNGCVVRIAQMSGLEVRG